MIRSTNLAAPSRLLYEKSKSTCWNDNQVDGSPGETAPHRADAASHYLPSNGPSSHSFCLQRN